MPELHHDVAVAASRAHGRHMGGEPPPVHILLKPATPGGAKGRTYPVGCHRPTIEVSMPGIRTVLRAFEIPEAAFWAGE